jgi:hypothetical protein
MKRRAFLCGVMLIASAAVAAPQSQKDESAIPNLASPEFSWQVSSGFYFLRIPGKLAPVGRGALEEGGERLGDADNPNLTPWAADRIKTNNELVRHGHRAFSAQSRCWPGGVPGQLLFVAEPVYFIQTPDEVWIVWQRDHLVRRIYLNREHSANVKPSWFGESVGHYENSDLVVDTIGLAEHEYGFVDTFTTPHTKDLHVVERWKIADGGDGLEATITVDDPGAFKQPWSGMVRLEKVNRPIEESACAENNLGYEQLFKLPEYPMPVANKPDF